MRRKIAVIAILALIAGSGAFAQISIGASGALYMNSFDMDQISTASQTGEGFFWGPFIEIGIDTFVIGVSGNMSLYNEDYFGNGDSYQMRDIDVAAYIQGHPLKYKNWLDPFVDAGIGLIYSDFKNKTEISNDDNPLTGSVYAQLGAGLNVNIGILGVFVKGDYLFNIGPAEGKSTDAYGVVTRYNLDPYDPFKNIKLMAGAKIILGR